MTQSRLANRFPAAAAAAASLSLEFGRDISVAFGYKQAIQATAAFKQVIRRRKQLLCERASQKLVNTKQAGEKR